MRALVLALLFVPVALCSYTVEFRGVEDEALLCTVKESSNLEQKRKDPPSSLTGLIERAESDIAPLTQLLHSQGHYNADVRYRLDRRSSPVRVVVTLQLGPRFPIARFAVLPADGDPGIYPYGQIPTAIEDGAPAVSEDILKAEESILCRMRAQGYALARLVDRQVVVDLSQLEVDVLLYIDSGPLCRFGPLKISGLCKVSERAIQKAVAWKVGEVYNNRCVTETCRRLRDMGLFNYVSLTHGCELNEQELLPMCLSVIERKQRTISIGVSYNTRELWGIGASWLNRNLRGQGDKLALDAEYNERKKLLGGLYRDIQWGHPDQDLLVDGFLKDDQSNPGYDERAVGVGVGVERRVNCRFRYSYGVNARQMQVSDSFNDGDYTTLGAPLFAGWDNSNDLLNPTKGSTAYLNVEPVTDLANDFSAFLKASLTGTLYYPVIGGGRLVLAGWASFGVILGTSNSRIPPPYRFYAGNDSSLRGYKYQSVGPTDATGKPIGGRSMMLYGVEARTRITCSLGFVTFFEMGDVFLSEWPRFDQKLLKSWGVGLRYFTPVGPLSLDVAFPLDRRPGIDKSLQVYLTVGQAF